MNWQQMQNSIHVEALNKIVTTLRINYPHHNYEFSLSVFTVNALNF